MRKIVTAPWRGLKALASMTFPRSAVNSYLLPASLRYLQQTTDSRASSVVMAPLNWITRTFPEAPIQVAQETQAGQFEVVGMHPLTLLLRRPNRYYSGRTMWAALVADLILNGNGYLLVLRDADGFGKPAELWYAPSTMVEPKGNAETFITHYEYTPNGIPIRLEPSDVIHFRHGIDPSNQRVGISPLHAILREVATDEEAQQFTLSILGNMGIPGIVISPEPNQPAPAAEDVQATKTYIQDQFSGDGRGAPLVMGGATRVEQFGFSPEQMNLRELRRIPEERVSAALGVPAIVAGLGAGLDRSTFANMSEAREMAYEDCIMPLQGLIADELARQLLPSFETQAAHFRIEFDTSNVRVLQEDEQRKIERLNTAVTGGWVSVAYAQREAFGIEPTEADAVYLRGVNIMAMPVGESFDIDLGAVEPPAGDGTSTTA